MPHPSKKFTQAKSQRQSGVSICESVPCSDQGSVYIESNDSGESNNDNGTPQSIAAMPNLYSKYLPAHLKAESRKKAGQVISISTSVGLWQEINGFITEKKR